MSFIHYLDRPERVSAEHIRSEYEQLIERAQKADAADSVDAWLDLIGDWNAFRSYYLSEYSRAHVRMASDYTDADATSAELYFRETVIPVVDELEDQFVEHKLESRYRAELERRFGSHMFRLTELARSPMAPVNADLRLREGELAHRHGKLMAEAELELDGRKMTLEEVRSLLASPDRAVRTASYVALYEWVLANRGTFGEIFDELVRVRHQMGLNLHYDGYTRLGYENMERTDYGPAETALFRSHVLKHFLPIVRSLAADHARRIGVERLSPVDVAYDPDHSLPIGIAGPVDTMLDRAARLFHALSPRLGAHFDKMRRENLIDLANRPGKYVGAFCAPISDEGRCTLLLNVVGDAHDVETLLHESGHAFQCLESTHIELVDQQRPTADLAEIHSTTMEFLGLRNIEELIPAEYAEKYRRNAWSGVVRELVSIARVDELQHWMYEHPDATVEQRERRWDELCEEFSTGVDMSGYEQYRPVSWYVYGHLYRSPFYLIDYALAQLCAMQVALIDATDHERAMQAFINLCRLGGTKSFSEAVASVGLRSPFDESLIVDLAGHARRQLGLA